MRGKRKPHRSGSSPGRRGGTATAGTRWGRTVLVIDANGTAGYQAGGDFLIEFDDTDRPAGHVYLRGDFQPFLSVNRIASVTT